jgi:hypothetical protein
MSIPSVPSTPRNPNLLPPNKFSLQVLALPDVQYWCQTVNIPGISIGEAPRNTPFIDLYSPGDKCILNPFSVTFYVDEDYKGWTQIFNWMAALTFPKNFDQYKALPTRFDAWKKPMPQFSDITLTVLDSKQNPALRIKYLNCFPVSLSDVVLSTTYSPEDTLTSDVTFRYDLYDIERI